MFGSDRSDIRLFYKATWEKAQAGLPLEPLEQMLADVIAMHPEYHGVLLDPESTHQEFTPEQGKTNPFLHLGLHMAVLEQLSVDRPPGIRDSYQRLLTQLQDEHQTQHQLIDCLAETLWQAQRDGTPPNEAAYLLAVQQLTI